jgi:hypothetical protein
MKETNEFIKCRLNANCLIFEEYLIYLIIRRENALMPNFIFINDEFDLIKQMCENNNIKYKSREDLEDVQPLLLKVLIKLVKHELNKTKIDLQLIDFIYHLYPDIDKVYKKLDYFKGEKEKIDLSKDLYLLNQINFRIFILQRIEKKLY